MTFNRRDFLAMTAAGLSLGPTLGQAPKSERKFRTALIGCGWWGMNILREAMAAGRSQVVALCDVSPRALDVSAEQVSEHTRDTPKKYRDYRELLDEVKPEVVIVATPDHWHALQTIAAVKAGAHVFVEKPTGHTVGESQAMLKAARNAGKVVQVGLHRRIGPHHVSGMKFLKNGGAGKVGMVRMFVVGGGGGPERPVPNTQPPKGMDWDLWCGPAPLRPFNIKLHPGGFRNFLDYANGTFGDWGAHWMDQVLWWAEEKYPRRVFSTGGRPVLGAPVLTEKEQTTDAPDSQVAVYEFDGFTAVWEHRRFADTATEKHKVGCYFHGTKGTFHMGWRDGWTFYPNGKGKEIHEKAQLQEPDGHNIKLLWADFLSAIDTGRRPVSDIEPAHRSTTAVLLGMLSLKLGRAVTWDGAKEVIVGDAEANALLRRKYREPWKYPEA
jgi:predicted dehydrogenase